VNNHSIPSTHAVKKITHLSDYHSFTLHPSLSPYRQNHRQRNKYTRFAWAGETFFPVVLLCAEIVLGDTYLPYQLCRCVFFLLRWETVFDCTGQFFGCGGK
jgi:hypothetical protein